IIRSKARGQIDKTLPLNGKYTILVRDEYNSHNTGNYCLTLQCATSTATANVRKNISIKRWTPYRWKRR
ncbi:MAG: hypothetical protein NC826_05440, partial [Candidatus Omnitrophica bacterium]|nr:hypothetical protein [Candidatus Omnitrophota bacterium]